MVYTASKTTAEVLSGAPNVAGYAFSAPVGTAAPVDTVTALAATYINLGFVDDAGITVKQGSKIIEMRDWNGDLVAALDDEVSAQITFTLMQTGIATQREIYGAANVTADVGTPEKLKEVAFTGDTLPHRFYVFDLKNSKGLQRILVEDGQITEVGDLKFVKKDVVKYPVTVTCYRAASGKFFRRLFSWA